MRSVIAQAAQLRGERRRHRSTSLSSVPPTGADYLPELALLATSILYRSPLPSKAGRPVYILNAAAFPDAFEIDYDSLLSYVLARLPGEEELLSGTEYEIIFFAGGQPDGATIEKKQGPGMGWYLQAYHVLGRATRKRLQRLYIVHPRTWVRVLLGVFGTIVSPKFRRKIVHVNALSALASHYPLENLLIPPSVYLHDRKLSPDIFAPSASGKRAFGVKHPLPKSLETGQTRLPRVLRETSTFLLLSSNVKTEGLFRIPPHSTLASILKEAYDRGQHYIIWKEKAATLVEPGIDPSLVDEVRLEDAYGVHLAASLIKQWYRDLREPIFPESSYEYLRQKYGDPDVKVSLVDLVDIILPAGDASPLTTSSRQILTRHLLPLLSEVAAREAENKMTPENLAICFSMCLVCGSNQLEDAKVSSIVKRILWAAIEEWPQLREGMNISPDAFFEALKPPADPREYDDPLEEIRPPPQRASERAVERSSEDDAIEGHRIKLEDYEENAAPGRPPALPPRSLNKVTTQHLPALPPRPSSSGSPDTPGSGLGSEPSSAIPKRKPAPPVVDPPRYSTVFDVDGNSLDVADSPASYAPANGFGPSRRSNWSYDEHEKKGFPPPAFQEPTEEHPALNVSKREALSTEPETDEPPSYPAANTASAIATTRSASESGLLAQMAAQKAAASLGRHMAATFNGEPPDAAVQSPGSASDRSPDNVLSEGDGVFRKPTWPASTRSQALPKPMLPPRQSQTYPTIREPMNGSEPVVSNLPRPRAPSPGLLKRMGSMEVAPSQPSPSLEPHKLNLKKQSVEALRRLYEERATTAQGLAKADSLRRTSSTTST